MTSVEVKPLWLVRLVARAPRIACITAAVVLSALGLAQLLRGEPRQASEPKTAPRGEDLAANSLRAFLTVEPASGGLEDPSWRAFGVDLPRPTAPSHAKPQHVTWTATVGDRPMRPGRRIVTVVAGVGSSLTYLAVPIERDDKHRDFVAGPPAIVGPPPIARGASSPAELEVDDPALRDVATRVVRHYLARDSQDLAADLDRSAIVTLPTQPLLLADVEAVTWVSRAPGCRRDHRHGPRRAPSASPLRARACAPQRALAREHRRCQSTASGGHPMTHPYRAIVCVVAVLLSAAVAAPALAETTQIGKTGYPSNSG